MATAKHAKTARRNADRAREAASSKRAIGPKPKRTRAALGRQGGAGAERQRSGGHSRKPRAEPNELTKQRDLPGRAKMMLDELARKLGYK